LFQEEVTLPFYHFPKSLINFTSDNKSIGNVAYSGGIAYTTPAASPALIGIGYIIGPRLAAINFSGGVLAWLLLILLVLFVDPVFPQRLGSPSCVMPSCYVIASAVCFSVVQPIAVGAILVGTVYTPSSTRESVLRSNRETFEASTKGVGKTVQTRL